jgi:hypothetical protein
MLKPLKKVKIASAISKFGGSTILFINLCKLFNDNGIVSQFYGPHSWHLDKYEQCRPIEELKIDQQDYLIGHMLDGLNQRRIPFFSQQPVFHSLPCRRAALYIHEKTGHYLIPEALDSYQTIVFASQSQKEWHGYYKGPQNQLVIPTPPPRLKKVNVNKKEKIAGIIGKISQRKLTHISILRALKEGCDKILLFGPRDEEYFKVAVKPLLSEKVIEMGEWPIDKHQEMYDMLTCVYHSASEESACLVQAECEATDVPFYGNCNTIPYEIKTDREILAIWSQVL